MQVEDKHLAFMAPMAPIQVEDKQAWRLHPVQVEDGPIQVEDKQAWRLHPIQVEELVFFLAPACLF